MREAWQVELLGALRARRTDAPDRAISRFSTQRTGLLLAYLAYHRERAHPRDRLVELLWPESDPESGRLSLRVALSALRRQLEPPGGAAGRVLIADRSTVRVAPEAVTTDVAAFQAALRNEERSATPGERRRLLRSAVDLYRGELLPGFYDDWVLSERQRLEERYLTALRELAALHRDAGELDAAIAALRQAAAVDPLREPLHHELILLFARAGRAAEARQQYADLERLLRDEIGTAPPARLTALVEALPRAARGHAAPAAVRMPERPAAAATDPAPHAEAELARPPAPLYLNRFFGREKELARLAAMLSISDCGLRISDCPDSPIPQSEFRNPKLTRLVTLTGPGGAGKTRLAWEAAVRRREVQEGQFRWVSLAERRDVGQMLEAVAEALGLAGMPELARLDQIAAALRQRGEQQSLLLVLDNFEQLLAQEAAGSEDVTDGAGALAQLLAAVPSMLCLVTSRQRLGIPGEQEFVVEPLPVPGEVEGSAEDEGRRTEDEGRRTDDGGGERPGKLPDRSSFVLRRSSSINSTHFAGTRISTINQYASVQLFLDRAQDVQPHFAITARNAEAVAALCTRLEGIPLALELAAAWAHVLTPAQMVARLGARFDLLVSRRQRFPARHRTLRAALEWSFDLLPPQLRQFLPLLSVFRGGFTLEAAEAVCGAGALERWDGCRRCERKGRESGPSASRCLGPGSRVPTPPLRHPSPGTLDALAQLRERSLLLTEEADGSEMRFRMLETVREHVAGYLSEAQARALATRHAAYFLDLSETADRELRGPDQLSWTRRLEADYANLVAALEGSVGETSLRLAAALGTFWLVTGRAVEGGRWLARAIDQRPLVAPGEGQQANVLARSLFAAAALACMRAEAAEARSLAAAAMRLCDDGDPPQALVAALPLLTHPSLVFLRAGVERELSTAVIRAAGQEESPEARAFCLNYDADGARLRGEFAAADALQEEALAIYRRIGDTRGVLVALRGQALTDICRSDCSAARRRLEEVLALYRQLNDRPGVAATLGELGYVARLQGDYASSESFLEEALALSRQMGHLAGVCGALWGLANSARRRGQYERAGALLQEALALDREIGVTTSRSADLLDSLGLLALCRGDFESARSSEKQALAVRRERRDPRDIAWSLIALGEIALREGEHAEAELHLSEALTLSREARNRSGVAIALRGLGSIAARQGDLDVAEQRLVESLELSREQPDRRLTAEVLEALAELRQTQGRPEEAAELLGTAAAIRDQTGAPVPPCDQAHLARMVATLRKELGSEVLVSRWERGQNLATLSD